MFHRVIKEGNMSFTKWKLHRAAKKEDIKTIAFLLEAGTDPNLKDKDDSTALHYATHEGHLEVVKFLIEHGANVNVYDRFFTTLHYATQDDYIICFGGKYKPLKCAKGAETPWVSYVKTCEAFLKSRKKKVRKTNSKPKNL